MSIWDKTDKYRTHALKSISLQNGHIELKFMLIFPLLFVVVAFFLSFRHCKPATKSFCLDQTTTTTTTTDSCSSWHLDNLLLIRCKPADISCKRICDFPISPCQKIYLIWTTIQFCKFGQSQLFKCKSWHITAHIHLHFCCLCFSCNKDHSLSFSPSSSLNVC